MFRINHILLILFLTWGVTYSGEGKVKIVLENGYYCTQLESGEKFQIVRQWEPQSPNTIVLSPDEKYVAYTTSNYLGFESEGRDVYYCKVDGRERTFLHKFEISTDTLLWNSFRGKDFIFVILMDCYYISGGIQVIDLKSKNIIYAAIGDSLEKIQGTDCYQVYCYWKPVQQGRQKICLEELSTIKEPISSDVSFYTGWGVSDLYVSTEREPILKLADLPKLAEGLGKKFQDFAKDRYFYISQIAPSPHNNRIVLIGGESLSFLGVFDVISRVLLLFDYFDSLKFSNPIWSPNGSHLAILRANDSGKYINFYEFTEPEKIELIKTYKVITDRPISDFRWSSDSNKFYFSYPSANYQKVETEIDLKDK